MASSYSLPASAITNSHHGHGHGHGHSHSSRSSQYSANRSRPLNQSTSSLHDHSHNHSETLHENEHENDHGHSHSHSHGHTHSHSHEHSTSYLPSPLYGEASPMSANYEKGASYGTYEPPVSDVHVTPHEHHDHDHDHTHGTTTEMKSRFTSLILPYAQKWPLLHTILASKDSRRIFYFMSLNFAFMIVQAFYGFVTDSLGLLSDSIHMFFDCLALGVGLFAAVASKWPPSQRFPYGFGKIESLSGFGNGVFLILISIEIMIEATERLAEGRETKRLMELFVVSSLGLAVNLVGMACFGHHHHGHDHGDHDHGHDHGNDQGHSHGHSHSHSHDSHSHDGPCEHDHKKQPSILHDDHSHSHSHGGHSHDNENMRGIFLHVLADTMGSAAVIVSTILIHFVGWSGWDPLASCLIAVLIFLSSIPLVKSSAKKLLLTIPDDTEYNLRNTLTGVSDLRGVQAYTVPKFWLGDKNQMVLGVMHVVATRGSDLEDVLTRTRAFLLSKGVDVVVQVEKDGDVSCWCGGAGNSSRSNTNSRFS
ncbi:0454955b-26bc-45b5-9d6e-19db3219dc48 [Sclerotinia trifoliorum]|uniref:Zinc transporter n=1 Tax=Sclerotinia trifoliorum TaxID=28548 RepID=A0A8H2ZRE3_9HELO|nr:0454955b-26bc-45b5-9d6e-19db3219dc48 [Sclerotinia trifoliorum]